MWGKVVPESLYKLNRLLYAEDATDDSVGEMDIDMNILSSSCFQGTETSQTCRYRPDFSSSYAFEITHPTSPFSRTHIYGTVFRITLLPTMC